MNIRKISLSLLLAALFAILACGYGEDNGKKASLYLSGTVDVEEVEENISGPVLIMVTNTDDLDEIEEDPDGTIIEVITVDQNDKSFRVNLADKGVRAGDEVFITAFADNDYDGNIPYPTAGDYVGFYIDTESLSMSYVLKSGENDGMEIKISREVFDFEDTKISGTVYGSEAGELTVLAYAGDVTSSDFSKLDTDGIIGFKKITKGVGPVSYSLDVFPYGYNMPAENVYVFALLDVNENDDIDGGDRVGYHSIEENDFPTLITVNQGETLNIDIDFYMDVMEESGLDVSLTGSFIPPEDYDDQAPVYIIVADAENVDALLDDPLSVIKYFQKMPAGEFIFDIDLSTTDLVPLDEVMVIALWDRDYDAGFPDLTKGDKTGFVQSKEMYAYTVELRYGENPIPSEGYEFKINRHVYDFDSSILYALDMENSGNCDPERAQMLVFALHVEGLEIGLGGPEYIKFDIDTDYILGLTTVLPTEYDYIGIGDKEDPDPPRILTVARAVFEDILVWDENEPPDPLIRGLNHGDPAESTAFLFAILDKDGDGELDLLSDEIGYYSTGPIEVSGETIEIPGYGEITVPDWVPEGEYYFPAPIPRISKGENLEEREGDELGPHWIIMNKFFEEITIPIF